MRQEKPEDLQIPARLQHYTEAAGKRQRDIAQELGLSEAAVSRWFSGSAMPSHENLAAFCRVAGVDLETFWTPLPKTRKAG